MRSTDTTRPRSISSKARTARFAEEVPKDKMLFFLGMILEDADPAERQAMMANLPAPARFVWRVFGQRQFRRRVSKIRAGLERS
jgi:hypothetical protein